MQSLPDCGFATQFVGHDRVQSGEAIDDLDSDNKHNSQTSSVHTSGTPLRSPDCNSASRILSANVLCSPAFSASSGLWASFSSANTNSKTKGTASALWLALNARAATRYQGCANTASGVDTGRAGYRALSSFKNSAYL
ncbi:hypothetical protein AcV5_009079 [Taiwanofungus camphoratus]|nr:hypothetical protein AcV5_009079 [Antrodia cinnamomea]